MLLRTLIISAFILIIIHASCSNPCRKKNRSCRDECECLNIECRANCEYYRIDPAGRDMFPHKTVYANKCAEECDKRYFRCLEQCK